MEYANLTEEQTAQVQTVEQDVEETEMNLKARVVRWFTKKRIILMSIGAVLTVAVTVTLLWLGNNWRTPIWNWERQRNKTAYYPEEIVQWNLNGLAGKEFKAYCRALKKSEVYCDLREEFYEKVEVAIDKAKKQFGEDYRSGC